MAEAVAAEKNMDTTQTKSQPKTSVVWENFTKIEKEGVHGKQQKLDGYLENKTCTPKNQDTMKVKAAINRNSSSIALTADAWISVATEAYLGITCHYIDWLEEVVAKYEIPVTRVAAIVHDNGANIVGAARLLEEKHGWMSVRCTSHTLQLVVNTAIKAHQSTERALGAARYLDLKPDQWSLLEELLKALKRFEVATVFMSGQNYVTISAVPTLVRGLLKAIQNASFESPLMKAFQATMTEQLKKQWDRETSFTDTALNAVIMSAALNPRFKKLKSLTPQDLLNVQAKVQTLALLARREEMGEQHNGADQTTASTTPPPLEAPLSLLDTLLDSDSSSESEDGENETVPQAVLNKVQSKEFEHYKGPTRLYI
ncbi:E3 SUMO-protein ligase ZBED1-like [Xyrichtys novacula]|uniref:E3 SUMO-protein ligase ZBED1-like n=1 Tax=Xyrichtys novacula TaxID=13765 RepID=A0AAV1HN14_XYRNO|nr:E3 SUMO-protein ligase ZBED1-like [Xyrichtys novacula]